MQGFDPNPVALGTVKLFALTIDQNSFRFPQQGTCPPFIFIAPVVWASSPLFLLKERSSQGIG